MSDVIQQIKDKLDIVELATQYGANPHGRGKAINTKFNPLRTEKTSSLKLYKDTNSYTDFGSGESGSALDFYMKCEGLDLPTAINNLKQEFGIRDYEVVTAPIPKQDYMKPDIVRKVFDQQKEIDFKTHKKLLYEIAPEWLYKTANSDDLLQFQNIVRKNAYSDVLMVLLHDEHKVERSIRYRHKMVGEELKKWVALAGTQSSVLYCRLTENPLTIVVEGTHDYLTAILMGYSVISLPSASYKGKIPSELTEDRLLIFIGDDNEVGQKCLDYIQEETICDKKRFIYSDFPKKGGDFSDLVFAYNSIEDFNKDFLEYIDKLPHLQDTNTWKNAYDKQGGFVTIETIKATENIKFLIENILPHNQITTFVGKPNVGKSALTFGLIDKAFESGQIEDLIYFDADNPLVYTKDRILKLIDKFGADKIKYFTGSTSSKDEMLERLHELVYFKNAGGKVLIVIDSLKNFIKGSVNDDKTINPLTDTLQAVRDKFGATLIVLHHTRKGKNDDGDLEYVGSQVIEASTDNMTNVSRDEVSEDLLLDNKKARALIPPHIAVEIDIENMTINASITEKREKKQVDLREVLEDLEVGKEYTQKYVSEIVGSNVSRALAKHKDIIKVYKNQQEVWCLKRVGGIVVEETTFNIEDLEGVV